MTIFNEHLVSVNGRWIIIQNPPAKPMTKKEALQFAAWIVALAEEHPGDFAEMLRAVQDT